MICVRKRAWNNSPKTLPVSKHSRCAQALYKRVCCASVLLMSAAMALAYVSDHGFNCGVCVRTWLQQQIQQDSLAPCPLALVFASFGSLQASVSPCLLVSFFFFFLGVMSGLQVHCVLHITLCCISMSFDKVDKVDKTSDPGGMSLCRGSP